MTEQLPKIRRPRLRGATFSRPGWWMTRDGRFAVHRIDSGEWVLNPRTVAAYEQLARHGLLRVRMSAPFRRRKDALRAVQWMDDIDRG